MPLLASTPLQGNLDLHYQLLIRTEMDAKNDDSPVLDYDGDGELDVEDEACYTAVATP